MRLLVSLLVLATFTSAQVNERNVRGHMEFLASDALQGRGSGTEHELIAATYIASQLRQFGVQAASDNGTFIQTVPVFELKLAEPPVLILGTQNWIHGKQIAVSSLNDTEFTGPLHKYVPGGSIPRGAVAFIRLTEKAGDPPVRDQLLNPIKAGAVAVLVADSEPNRKRFAAGAAELPEPRAIRPTIIFLDADATKQIEAAADGAPVTLKGKLKPQKPQFTWNVIGVIPGIAGPKDDAILLSAHLDHVGVHGDDLKKDNIYNGADDDASGVTAVLELARALASGEKPKRTVYFAFFGSEEKGGYGAQHFIAHTPVPLEKIAANLEFEMIGRSDPKVAAKTLWLTGYDRSNLGPELAKQGARLVADPHPEQSFFTRSDNYVLAKRGVVAHTVSSYGLHPEYHQPNDDLAHIDFAHMTEAINSMVAPVRWLANSNFRPQWLPGRKP